MTVGLANNVVARSH